MVTLESPVPADHLVRKIDVAIGPMRLDAGYFMPAVRQGRAAWRGPGQLPAASALQALASTLSKST